MRTGLNTLVFEFKGAIGVLTRIEVGIILRMMFTAWDNYQSNIKVIKIYYENANQILLVFGFYFSNNFVGFGTNLMFLED